MGFYCPRLQLTHWSPWLPVAQPPGLQKLWTGALPPWALTRPLQGGLLGTLSDMGPALPWPAVCSKGAQGRGLTYPLNTAEEGGLCRVDLIFPQMSPADTILFFNSFST